MKKTENTTWEYSNVTRYILWGLFVLLSGLFLFTRFYKIDSSFLFFNDMGRDLFVLYEWLKLGKIPLLGPLTSSLPINQSPIYFYLLMPLFVISHQSVYTALIMNAILYLTAFTASYFLAQGNIKLQITVLIVMLLTIFHPQQIAQNRFVWNPSFLTPFLMVSIVYLLRFFSKNNSKDLIFSVILCCIALAIHYSAASIFIAYIFIILIYKKEYFLKCVLTSFITLTIVNITVIRQLIKNIMATGYIMRPDQFSQPNSGLFLKLHDITTYLFNSTPSVIFNSVILGVLVAALYVTLTSKEKMQKVSASLFLITFVTTLIMPFNIQAHYIFAMMITLFFFVSMLNLRIAVTLVIILLYLFIKPDQLKHNFAPAPRTYNQMEACFKSFCSTFKQPTFVSVESGMHPYHFGPEHRYLMLKNGCDVRSIEEDTHQAQYMSVVVDNGSFSDKTSYYELDLFGTHSVDKKISCGKNFEIVVLKK
ncbi:MAG: hypothetical protein ABIO02_04295 [Patescibacteria group bacterium]